ncbi:polyphosphate kinase [Actinobaculum suis]|nr:polyphosphate kinase [Actinobaculum suis]
MEVVSGPLTAQSAETLQRIAHAAEAADGTAPFDEQTLLDVAAGASSSKVWQVGEPAVGIAHRGRNNTVELAVLPQARGTGVGTALLRAAARDGETDFWAHGDLPAAQYLAEKEGLLPGRELLVLERSVGEDNPAPEPGEIPGVVISTFDPDVDFADLVQLNATAFATHPEQGALQAADFRARMREPWFSPELLLVAKTEGTMIGFLWLKPQEVTTPQRVATSQEVATPQGAGTGAGPEGETGTARDSSLEIYVLGVDPEYAGRGLGTELTHRALLVAQNRGFEKVILYVDGDNEAAVRVYEKADFHQAQRHVLYHVPLTASLSAARGASPATAADVAKMAEVRAPETAEPEASVPDSVSSEGAAQQTAPENASETAPEDTAETVAEVVAAAAAQAAAAQPEDSFHVAARLGSPVSTKSLTQMAKEARAEAKRAAKAPEESKLPQGRFADRELSWLAFNERVLEQSEDQSLPLLERAWFLSIFSSNLDEFFMVRVAGLKRRIRSGIAVTAASGLTPRQVMNGIEERTHELTVRHARVFLDDVAPKLADQGIRITRWHELGKTEKKQFSRFFKSNIFPVLTPLAVDPSHPFPYISGLSLNLAVRVEDGSGATMFARVKVPDILPRFIALDPQGNVYRAETIPAEPEEELRFLPLEELIGEHLGELFPGMQVKDYSTFRVTRNEDLEVEEDDAENLLTALEKELMKRRFGPVVRLEVDENMAPEVLQFLMSEMDIGESDVYRLPAPLDLTSLDLFHSLDRPALKYPKYVPVTPVGLTDAESAQSANLFKKIRQGEVLVQHPYESFSTSVQAFIAQAAADPKVLAIKQTLYRTSGDSPIIDSLIQAAQAGKQVLAIVEIKARFDEERNIGWARKLERAGVHVVYGMVGLKTHCKLCLVVRQEGAVLRRYCHVGTGNYNPKTARGYEDLGLFTCDRNVGQDLTRLFNQLSGYAPAATFHRLLVAPTGIRAGLVERIEKEIANKNAGKPAWIKIKCNSIIDETMIDALYRASQAGVPVWIQVRGICGVRAGIPGLSENIRVRSILGRYLEHSRIYAFCNDGDTDVWIGSADLMHRNLDRRVEALIKIVVPEQIERVVELIDVAMADSTSSWRLGPDGWVRHNRTAKGRPLVDIQDLLMRQARSKVAGSQN